MQWLPLAILLAASAQACTAPAPEPGPGAAPALDGRWRAVSIGGRPVGRGIYTIVVRDGRVVGGRDGCNDWGYVRHQGDWAIESTAIGCPDDPLQRLYFAALDPETHRLQPRDGTLVVAAGGAQATFRREAPPAPPAPLPQADGHWQAISIGGAPAGPRDYTILVEGGRVVGGYDGCNNWGYVWHPGGWAIQSELQGCADDPLQRAYYQALQPDAHQLSLGPDGTLRVSADGQEAVFRRAPPRRAQP